MTEVFFFSPISLSILYLIHQLRMISVTTRTKGPLLFISQPQTKECRNQKMALLTIHQTHTNNSSPNNFIGLERPDHPLSLCDQFVMELFSRSQPNELDFNIDSRLES